MYHSSLMITPITCMYVISPGTFVKPVLLKDTIPGHLHYFDNSGWLAVMDTKIACMYMYMYHVIQ